MIAARERWPSVLVAELQMKRVPARISDRPQAPGVVEPTAIYFNKMTAVTGIPDQGSPLLSRSNWVQHSQGSPARNRTQYFKDLITRTGPRWLSKVVPPKLNADFTIGAGGATGFTRWN